MPTADEILDHHYAEMRWRVLSLAADFDRLQRAGSSTNPRVAALHECLQAILSDEPGRAERVQHILSDKTPPPDR